MATKNDVMTMDEAKERFAGNYLALEVVKRDRQHTPVKVRLIAKARSRAGLSRKIRGVREAAIIFAGPLFPEGSVILY